MNMAGLAFIGPIDRARHAIERINAVDYLSTSYYEHWLTGLLTLTQELGYVTAEELATGRAAVAAPLPFPAPGAGEIESLLRVGLPASRASVIAPVFAIGSRVRARNLELAGHTRLARYVRGKVGSIVACHGCHVFPDTNAHDLGENPQPLYTVRFEARELWGDNVTRKDCVLIDLWESYLQPIAAGEASNERA